MQATDDNNAEDVDGNNGNLKDYQLQTDSDASNVLPASKLRRACHLMPKGDQAIFFAGEQFVTINLTSGMTDTVASPGSQTIIEAWPGLHQSMFPEVDAILGNPANSNEAYFFLREKYVLMDITTRQKVFEPKVIVDEWPSLKSAGFTTVDAAVLMDDSSAYIFRGDQYVRITVAPGTNNDTIITGPKPIAGNWHVLDNVGFTTVDAILTSPVGGNQYFFSGVDYVRMVITPGEQYW